MPGHSKWRDQEDIAQTLARGEFVLPPGQQRAAPGKWPIVGEREPAATPTEWIVEVTGAVARPCAWTLSQLHTLPCVEQIVDVHCVTRWSQPGMRFGGIPLAVLLAEAIPLPHARYVSFVAHSVRQHSTSLVLRDALELGTLVVLFAQGRPLAPEHGGPVRIVTPGRYFYKSVKWLRRIELLEQDRLGYWEAQAGYHNRADPWREERYMAPNLDRRHVMQLLRTKQFSGCNLRGLDASGRDLAGLDARGAILRDAHFERACLRGARFDGANLSNAWMHGADLRYATFGVWQGQRADLEGASFLGADVRGADFRSASLLAAVFCPVAESAAVQEEQGAIMDSSTLFLRADLEALMPPQREYVEKHATVLEGDTATRAEPPADPAKEPGRGTW